ncbi:hypothetical protein BaRGS_00037270 [Batillaria attramentaria]|uniref:Uncharacterized protein n=1 Tax=Batillaria attramentaria TaxID=370345 RepID=A0ABD0JA22_9CAEN
MGAAACTAGSVAEDKHSQPLKILVLGFSGTGKTFIVYGWSLGMSNMVKTLPTDAAMFNVEKVMSPKLRQPMYMWDISGKMTSRRRSYFLGTQGLVYVLNASQPVYMMDALQDLNSLLNDRDLKGLPLLVLANRLGSEENLSTKELESQMKEHLKLPPLWSVCGIRTFSQEDLSQALLKLEDLMDRSSPTADA